MTKEAKMSKKWQESVFAGAFGRLLLACPKICPYEFSSAEVSGLFELSEFLSACSCAKANSPSLATELSEFGREFGESLFQNFISATPQQSEICVGGKVW